MRYVSIDIEGTGLDIEKDQVLQLGAVVDDTSWWNGDKYVPVEALPTFNAYVLHDRIEGQVGALALNAEIIKLLKGYMDLSKFPDLRAKFVAEYGQFCQEYELPLVFRDFLLEHYHTSFSKGLFGNLTKKKSSFSGVDVPNLEQITITVAGKNFGTYDRPMLRRLPRWDKCITMRQTMLDPTMLYWDPVKDEKLPSLDVCLERAGLGIVSHDAVEDARDVIRVIRKKYEKNER